MKLTDATPTGYGSVMKFAHWLTLALIIAVFVLANVIDLVPDTAKETVTQLHRSVVVIIWVVTLARLMWRQFARLPDWPANMSARMRIATKVSEHALYALLLLQPLLGLIYTNASGDRVKLFLVPNIPALIGTGHSFADAVFQVHGAVANILLVLIGLHAATGLFRHFRRHDNALKAMLPNWI